MKEYQIALSQRSMIMITKSWEVTYQDVSGIDGLG